MNDLSWSGKLTALLWAGVLFWAGRSRPQERPQARDLNVLFITLDTTRADHLSCYGEGKTRSPNRGGKTPHIDELGGRGTRFAHATAHVPLTLPSHACMFTGTYPEVHQLRDMGDLSLTRNMSPWLP
jgi:arylsulfatase A-like enzyme